MDTQDSKLKTHDVILLILLAMLFVFGIVAYFATPKDAENAKVVIGVVKDAIGLVLAFKFGIHQATQPLGTSQLTKTVTPPDPEVVKE